MHANDPAANAACRARATDDYELEITLCGELPDTEPEPDPEPSWPEHVWEWAKSVGRRIVDGTKRVWRTVIEFVRDNWLALLLLLLALLALMALILLWPFIAPVIPWLFGLLVAA